MGLHMEQRVQATQLGNRNDSQRRRQMDLHTVHPRRNLRRIPSAWIVHYDDLGPRNCFADILVHRNSRPILRCRNRPTTLHGTEQHSSPRIQRNRNRGILSPSSITIPTTTQTPLGACARRNSLPLFFYSKTRRRQSGLQTLQSHS